MIRRARFENFKALRDVEITFDERLTVLVGPNGSGKSSVLQGIHIQSLVERNGTEQGNRVSDRILIDYKNAKGVPAEAVSDGTLFVIGLLTVVYGSEHIRTVLCDDLDHGLHPKAQMELIRVLQELIHEVPDLQIIATSHSLYVLSELPESSIRVLTLGPDGGAVCGRLSDHPDYERWKEAMTPGEFWSHVGEDWLLKREPAAVAQ